MTHATASSAAGLATPRGDPIRCSPDGAARRRVRPRRRFARRWRRPDPQPAARSAAAPPRRYAYQQQGRLAEAAAAYEAVLRRLSGRLRELEQSRQRPRARSADLDGAVEAFQQAIRLSPT